MGKIITAYLNTRKLPDLIQNFKENHVTIVLDVRYSTFCLPDFNPKIFNEACEKNGIIYTYRQDFGNPKGNRPPKQLDFTKAKACYRKMIENKELTTEFNLKRIAERVFFRNEILCVICYCPTEDPKRCHRFWIKEMIEEKMHNISQNK